MNKKISGNQLFILIFIVGIFKTITYNPFEYASFFQIILTVSLSFLINSVLLIPVFIISYHNPNESIITIFSNKNKFLGKIISAIYLVYFLLVTIRATRQFGYFMKEMFPTVAEMAVVIAIISICGLYAAILGIEAISRSAGIIFIISIIIFISFILTSLNYADFSNLYDAVPKNSSESTSFFTFLSREIATFIELTPLLFLISNIKNAKTDFNKGITKFLIVKFLTVIGIFTLTALVFGGYAKNSGYPFFRLGSLSSTYFVERYDGVYMILWILTAVTTISYFLYSAKECSGVIFKNKITQKNILTTIFAIITATSSILLSGQSDKLEEVYNEYFSAIYLIFLIFIIPLFALILGKNSRKE